MQAKEIMNKSLEMKSGKENKQKVQSIIQRRSLFDKLPDEMVLTILSYNDMEDIESTRGWQSKKVQHYTETRSKMEAAKKDNLDNLKWIYEFIGDTDFNYCRSIGNDEFESHYGGILVFDEDGNRILNSATGN